jgi:putative ABC transport system substrate-binding protein
LASHIGRRKFLATLGGVAAAWPLAAGAQQQTVPLIGLLSSRSAAESANHVGAFREGLSQVGYVEGQNVTIDYRWADGRYDQLPTLASELVARRVTAIAAVGRQCFGP